MTENEFKNLKSGDVVYQLTNSYETDMPIIEKCIAVGRCESMSEWIVRPFDRDEDYTWANRYRLFLTRKEAEKEAIDDLNRRIEDNIEEIRRYKDNVKRLESNLLNFYQKCIEIKSE